MPHFHIPLQSGDDVILKSMRRKYSTDEYFEKIQAIRHSFPEASFGADVIAGYPGETEESFHKTLAFVRKTGLSHLHVFPYAKRQKTTAAKLPFQIQSSVKKDRVRELIDLGREQKQLMQNNLLGKKFKVLFESYAI